MPYLYYFVTLNVCFCLKALLTSEFIIPSTWSKWAFVVYGSAQVSTSTWPYDIHSKKMRWYRLHAFSSWKYKVMWIEENVRISYTFRVNTRGSYVVLKQWLHFSYWVITHGFINFLYLRKYTFLKQKHIALMVCAGKTRGLLSLS